MKSFAKTIRFYDTYKDQVALKAMEQYADYGFSSANEMVVSALYELAGHAPTTSGDFPLDELADKITERLKSCLPLSSGVTPDATASNTPSGPDIWSESTLFEDCNPEDFIADLLAF